MAPRIHKNIQAEGRKDADNDKVFNVRTRFTIAQINAGAELLPKMERHKYRIVDMAMLAVGGAVGTATAVVINATQGGSAVALLTTAIAALTQNTLVRAGAANAVILTGGDSFAVNDVNTSITVGKTGGTADTATHVDIMVNYVIEDN